MLSSRRRLGAALAAVACLAAPARAERREEYSRSFDKALALRPGQRVLVIHRHGDLVVRGVPGGELRVAAQIRVSAPTREEANRYGAAVEIRILEEPDAVRVTTFYPRSLWRDVSFSVDYDIQVPEAVSVSLANSFGNVTVSGMKAAAGVKTAHGRLNVTDGRGVQRLENAFGSIVVQRVTGDVTVISANGEVSATTLEGALTVTNRFGRVVAKAVRGGAHIVNSNADVDLLESGGPSSVRSSFGTVTVAGVAGELSVNNQNGRVLVTAVKGPAVVRNTFGAVELRDVDGRADVHNSNGAVTVRDVDGAVEIQGSFGRMEASGLKQGVRILGANGDVAVSDVAGAAFLKTSFGQVQAQRIAGALTVVSANGGVRASTVQGGAQVSGSFGPVILDGMGGTVEVKNQNGAVELALAPATACSKIMLATSFAPIRLIVPAQMGFDLTSRTSFGSIRTVDVPVTTTGEVGAGRLHGTVGGGGCAVVLTNANGDIEIRKAGR
jgi:DUF4097 and DUF4098 domain-containing protein YvlB